MTETIVEHGVDTDTIDLLDFESAIPCEEECDNEADFKCVMKCCADTFFICESCLFEWLEYNKDWFGVTRCQACLFATDDPKPFVVTRLDRGR